MKTGSLSERYLKKAVFKHIEKADKNELGAKIGGDYSLTGDMKLISADGTGENPSEAFYKALNNFCCSFSKCEYLRIAAVLPECVKESEISRYMAKFSELASIYNIKIIGGDSKVVSYILKPYFTCTMLGNFDGALFPERKKVQPEFEIVCAGSTGILGTNKLIDEQLDTLMTRFSSNFLNKSVFEDSLYSIEPVRQIVCEQDLIKTCNICYMHDVSDGGIFRSLWELGEWVNRGIFIDNMRIPIEQETIEICEALDLNPYMIDGTGCALIVCEDGRMLAETLRERGIEASVIGTVTKDKEKLVRLTDDDIRKLEPF